MNFKKQFFSLISIIFDFYILAPLIFLIFIINLHLKSITIIYASLYFFVSFIAFIIIKYLQRDKDSDFISINIEDGNRVATSFYFSAWLLFIIIFLTIIGSSRVFLSFLEMFFVIMLLASIVSIFWRISYHSILSTSFTLILIYFYGYIGVLFVIALILVWYSRIYLRKHSIKQLIAGFLLVLVIFFTFLYLHLL